jgi:hypothetical protein
MNDRHPNHPDNDARHDPRTGEIDDAPVMDGEILEPIGTGVVAALHRVEVDHQVATAKAYPRNVAKIKQELTALVTMDEDTADDCIYALPRGNKHIKGPSARFADALISFWGNARSGAFITEVNKEDKYVEAIGSFQDVERNVIRQRRVRRPIATARGQLYNADMINMTGNAACVIAERNAILNGIPKSLWSGAYEQAFALVAGTVKTLGEKLERAEKHFAAMGISMPQVLEKLDRADVTKIIPDDIVTMRGMLTALRTGEETVETIFGRGAGQQHESLGNVLKDDPKAEPRGNARELAGAATVIDAASMVTKSPNGEVEAPILDLRFAPGKQVFETVTAWLKATENMPRPAFPEQRAESGGKSSVNPAEGQGKAQGEQPKTASANRTPTDPISSGVTEGAGKPAGEPATTGAAEQLATETGARTATAAKPEPAKPEATAPAGKAYEDAETYLGWMRDILDTKGKAVIVDLWGKTRGDRNELLSKEQIDEITADKEAKLKALKLQESK